MDGKKKILRRLNVYFAKIKKNYICFLMFTVREVRCLHQKASNPSRERLDYPRLQKQPRRQIVANVAKYWKTRNRTFCHSFYSCCYKMRNTYLEEAVCALWAKLIYRTDANIRISRKNKKYKKWNKVIQSQKKSSTTVDPATNGFVRHINMKWHFRIRRMFLHFRIYIK